MCQQSLGGQPVFQLWRDAGRQLQPLMDAVCLLCLPAVSQEQCRKLRDEREGAMKDLAVLRCDLQVRRQPPSQHCSPSTGATAASSASQKEANSVESQVACCVVALLLVAAGCAVGA